MRETAILRYGKRASVTAGLAALVATTACQPLAAADHSASVTTKHIAISTAKMPTYKSPFSDRAAQPHAVWSPSIYAYPWANDQSNTTDAYGMTERQCTSYAAWYINSRGTPFGHFTTGPAGTGVFGNATSWDTAARQAGFTVSTTPVVGSIAQWHSKERTSWNGRGQWFTYQAGDMGHVGVVTAVHPDGTVDIAQYNYNGNRGFSIERVRAPRFIYVPLAAPQVG